VTKSGVLVNMTSACEFFVVVSEKRDKTVSWRCEPSCFWPWFLAVSWVHISYVLCSFNI